MWRDVIVECFASAGKFSNFEGGIRILVSIQVCIFFSFFLTLPGNISV